MGHGVGYHIDISIHTLREEGDPIYHGKKCGLSEFLSTPSARRATGQTGAGKSVLIFLSTPSVRRATIICCAHSIAIIFLSTPSVRRATK